ncbi:GNAT family N-acetyltransferase [Gelidibacter sp.]|uniref:GNAT family N-acetyltransferase n=1 Tax=Gelidibacter sp. TaxID=2018083 RepID=UPI003262CF8B
MIQSKIYTSTTQIPPEWNTLATHDLFLQTAYLTALEGAAPRSISLYYIGIFNEDRLVGIALIQRVKLYAKDMFRASAGSQWKAILKDGISRILKGNILVVGNLTHTGQHGMYFKNENFSQDGFLETLFKAIDDLKILIKKNEHKSIRAILFKDFFKADRIHESSKIFDQHGFSEFKVQPNMILDISPNWKNMEDYLNDLNTKYKTRYKRAKKKLGKIRLSEMTQDEVLENSEHLYHLYKNVSTKAAFNTFLLPEHHFFNFKLELQEKFRVFTFNLNNEIIGFYTLLLNGETLETYFLGYDDAHQYKNQLYLNMLYEMLAFGIEHNFKTIVYARTAMEIKSSVGAKPKSMSIYIKHTNPIINAILKSIFKLMNPEQQWEERNPFKNPRYF